MAMRASVTQEEFYQTLRDKGFQQTAGRTEHHTLWFTPAGEHILVPAQPDLPEWLMLRFLDKANKLYEHECHMQKDYQVVDGAGEKDGNVLEMPTRATGTDTDKA